MSQSKSTNATSIVSHYLKSYCVVDSDPSPPNSSSGSAHAQALVRQYTANPIKASTQNERTIAGVRATTSTVPVTVPGSSTAREYKTGSTAAGPSHWEAESRLSSAQSEERKRKEALILARVNQLGLLGEHWK